MADKSLIEWTEATWNPVTGCSKISKGCLNCYAEKLAKRLKAMGLQKYKNGFKVTLHPEELSKPSAWRTPRIIFVNSMSDLFHEKVSFAFINKVFDAMNKADRHIFQILTKRSERLAELAPKLTWGNNIWMGVTVESAEYHNRIEHLSSTPARLKFLSLEPLLSHIHNLTLTEIDWVIVGGESGFRSRPISADWIREIQQRCLELNTPFFFKQWGGVNKKKNGRMLDGKLWNEMPNIDKNNPACQLTF